MTQTLKGLLEQAKVSRGVTSGRALAELTSGREHTIDRTQVNALLKGTYKSKPGKHVLEAIAWLAGVDVSQAYEAAQLPVPGPPFAQELPPGVDDLDPQQRHAVITVIRAFLGSAAEEGGEGHVDSPAPKGGAGSPGALPDLNEAREARRKRLIEDAQPQERAGYDKGDGDKGDDTRG